MAVSGSNNYNETEEVIIKDALVLVGGLEDDETPSSQQRTFARRVLNRLVKAWSVKGLKAWCWTDVTLTMPASQGSFEVGPTGADLVGEKPIEIDNPRVIQSGSTEIPVHIYTRSEFAEIPEKLSEGVPTCVFYERNLENGTFYVWPRPSTEQTLKFSSKQYIEDFDGATNNPYFPPEWFEAIVYNLALRLAPKYEVRGEELRILRDMAMEFLRDAEYAEFEEGSLFLSPEARY